MGAALAAARAAHPARAGGSPRGGVAEELRRRFAPGAARDAAASPSLAAALEERPRSRSPGEPIIVAGSLYLVGEARALLLSGRMSRRGHDDGVAPFTREHFERLEEERLAVYASRSARARASPRARRARAPADARTDYARDRDRIIHSRAFRRLKHKTQVFIPYEGDHFRTRLTHTIEVSQIARSVARALGLNEDLTEAIALGHDLGHTPFGHSGEYVLDRLLRESHPEAGGFKHNFQSVRVVDRLEKRYDEPGLNLTARRARGDAQAHGWSATFRFRSTSVEGLRLRSRGARSRRSGQLVRRDRAADPRPRGRPAADRGRRDRGARDLAASCARRAAYGQRPPPRGAPSLIRGMIAALSSDLVEGSRGRIERWLEVERDRDAGRLLRAPRPRCRATSSASPMTGRRCYRS